MSLEQSLVHQQREIVLNGMQTLLVYFPLSQAYWSLWFLGAGGMEVKCKSAIYLEAPGVSFGLLQDNDRWRAVSQSSYTPSSVKDGVWGERSCRPKAIE